MKKAPLLIIGLIVAIVLFLVLCTFVQRPYEQVIVERAGKIVDPGTLYRGWKICLPTDKTTRIDTRNHLYTSTVSEVLTGDSQTLTVRTYVAWKIVDAKLFYLRLKEDSVAENRVGRAVGSRVSSAIGEHKASQFFNTDASQILTEKIEKDVVAKVNDDLRDVGLAIHQVGFSRISFPPAVADSVNRNTAQERQSAAEKLRTEGIKEGEKLKNDAKSEADGRVAKAKEAADFKRGQADRDAISILGAVTDNPYSQQWYQIYKASEWAKATFARGNNIIMLSPDSLIVKTFFSTEVPPPLPAGIPKPPEKRPIPAHLIPPAATAPAAAPASAPAPIESVDSAKILPGGTLRTILPPESK